MKHSVFHEKLPGKLLRAQDFAPYRILSKGQRMDEFGVVKKGCASADTLKYCKKGESPTKQNTHGKITPLLQNIYSLTFTGHPKRGGQWSVLSQPSVRRWHQMTVEVELGASSLVSL